GRVEVAGLARVGPEVEQLVAPLVARLDVLPAARAQAVLVALDRDPGRDAVVVAPPLQEDLAPGIGAALLAQHRGQALARPLHRRGQSGQGQERGREVDELDGSGDGAGAYAPRRPAEDERHAHGPPVDADAV